MPRFVKVQNIPCWSAGYFVDSDTSGMSDEDVKLCTDYEKRLLRDSGCRLVCPIDDTRNEFCSWPAFGLGCDVEDYWAERVPTTRVAFRKYSSWDRSGDEPVTSWKVVAFLLDVLPSDGSPPPLQLALECGKLVQCNRPYPFGRPCTPEEYEKTLDALFGSGYRVRVVKRVVKRRKNEKQA